MADSLTWLTLPGAEVRSALNMVWIESITSTFGLVDSIIVCMDSISISETTSKSWETVESLLLLILICLIDSSPET